MHGALQVSQSGLHSTGQSGNQQKRGPVRVKSSEDGTQSQAAANTAICELNPGCRARAVCAGFSSARCFVSPELSLELGVVLVDGLMPVCYVASSGH